VLPDYVAIDLSSCETSSDLATVEYLVSKEHVYDPSVVCTTPLCKRVDRVAKVPKDLMRGFISMVTAWTWDRSDLSFTTKKDYVFRITIDEIDWRIDRQQVTGLQDGRIYHVYAVQVSSTTYASIRIPAGYLVGPRRIRNAFFLSQQKLQTATLHVQNNMPAQIGNLISRYAIQCLIWVVIYDQNYGTGPSGSLAILANNVVISNESKTDDSNIFTIFLVSDAYGSTETSWNLTRLYKNNTTEIANKYVGTYLSNATYNDSYVLDVGKYNFTIFDSGKNGICCDFGNGTYTVRLGQTILKTGSNFGAYETTIFEVQHSEIMQNVTTTLVPAQNPNLAPGPKKTPISLKKRSRPPKLSH
jgi:hypothetical protein